MKIMYLVHPILFFKMEKLKKHFGTSDFDGKIPMGDDAIFRLASMTKPITAVAIMILIDRILISLSTPVCEFLPEFENVHVISPDGVDLGKTKTVVTVMHLLTHTSGFGSHSKTVPMSDIDKENIDNTIKCFIKAGLDFDRFQHILIVLLLLLMFLRQLLKKLRGKIMSSF